MGNLEHRAAAEGKEARRDGPGNYDMRGSRGGGLYGCPSHQI